MDTFAIPCQLAHELSTSPATSRANPCQARYISRLGRLIGCWFGLFLARIALVTRLTSPALSKRPPQRAAVGYQAPARTPASVRRDQESPRAPAAAVVSAPGGPARRCKAPDRAPRCTRSAVPAGFAGSIEPVRCPVRP